MKNTSKVIVILCACFALLSCSKEDEIPVDVEVNDFIWKGLNAYYLYQDKIADLSDRRFSSQPQLNSYLRTFDSNTLFSNLLYDVPNTDNKSVLVDDYTSLSTNNKRESYTTGVEFGIIAEPSSTTNVVAYVSHILPNSDAASQSIDRGEFFNKVDGVQLTRDNYQSLLINGATSFEISMVNFDGTIVTPTAKKVTLTKSAYLHENIFLQKTIVNGANTIGYLMYNNDFYNTYIEDLNQEFLAFKNQNVNQLVLDLRYNIGGGSFAKNVSQIASMITGQFADKTLMKKKWNTKAQPWFEVYQPDSLLVKFPTELDINQPINSLELTDVYIILNGQNFSGTSAIELLINSLKSYVNVHVIGRNTQGNNKGLITLYNSDDYNYTNRSANHTFAIQPVVLTYLNADDVTFENGIAPSIEICSNEDILNLGTLGDTSDPILNRVLNYVNTGNTGANSACNSFNFEFLYNSTNAQRRRDSGVFIEQELPNTN